VPEIPKGAGGKIRRSDLAAKFSKTQPAAEERGGKMVLPRSELEGQLAGIWAEILDIDQIGVDQDVFALGVDSLAMMQMIMRLEEHFRRRLLTRGHLRCTNRCRSRASR
jgi:hypothetical protein